MKYILPQYSRSEVNRAGEILAEKRPASDTHSYDWAYTVMSNWRAAHAYPLNTFQGNVRARLRKAGIEELIAQRLKRLPSVVHKLQRFPKMTLARMQDMGGMRVVLPTVADVRRLRDDLLRARFDHVLVNDKDYLSYPKESGYRGMHLVYRYCSDTPGGKPFDGLCLEIQLRTPIQHQWATAVETVGDVQKTSLKSGEGDAEWLEDFHLLSALCALEERTVPPIKYQGMAVTDLIQRAKERRIVQKLENIIDTLMLLDDFQQQGLFGKRQPENTFYVVYIRYDGSRSSCAAILFSLSLEEALNEYNRFEQEKNHTLDQVVMVRADSLQNLQKLYPNYFADMSDFMATLHNVLNPA